MAPIPPEARRPDLVPVIYDLYWERGRSLRRVGIEVGLSYSTVREIMRRVGMPCRGRGAAGGGGPRVPPAELDRTVFLYEQLGLSTTEIGEVLGISTAAAQWRLRRMGVPMRSRGESSRRRFARRPSGAGAPVGVAVAA